MIDLDRFGQSSKPESECIASLWSGHRVYCAVELLVRNPRTGQVHGRARSTDGPEFGLFLAVSTTQNYANLISSSKSNDESKFDPATIGKMKEMSEWKTLVKVYKMGYLFLHLKWAILGITSEPQNGPNRLMGHFGVCITVFAGVFWVTLRSFRYSQDGPFEIKK